MYSRSQHSFCIINSDAIIPHNGFTTILLIVDAQFFKNIQPA